MVSIVLFSCNQTPQEKLTSRVEELVKKELIPKLKDPKSFEKVSIVISDTITEQNHLKEIISSNLKQMDNLLNLSSEWTTLDIQKSKEYLNESLVLGKQNDSLHKVIDKTNPTEISRIEITYTYRAKNGFGALDIDNVKVCYIPSEDKLYYWGK